MRTAWLTLVPLALALAVVPGAVGSAGDARQGGTVRVLYRGADLDSLDPALSYSVGSFYLVDPTCALLLRPSKVGLKPEVAAALPRIKHRGKTYTFTLRDGFRFSDGAPVRANAFANAIDRMLAPEVNSPWAAYLVDIVGAQRVLSGKAVSASGVVARGNTLVIRLARQVPDFSARTSFLCAVPPNLPADREGIAVFAAAGPYHVADYCPNDRVLLQRNRFYGGTRPQRVEEFDVDLRASSQEEVLDQVGSGAADWGWALPQVYFDPARRLAAKYGVNKSRFFVEPGTTFRGYAFNTPPARCSEATRSSAEQ